MERGCASAEDDDVVRLVVVPNPRGHPREGEDQHQRRCGYHDGVEQQTPRADETIANTSKFSPDGRRWGYRHAPP